MPTRCYETPNGDATELTIWRDRQGELSGVAQVVLPEDHDPTPRLQNLLALLDKCYGEDTANEATLLPGETPVFIASLRDVHNRSCQGHFNYLTVIFNGNQLDAVTQAQDGGSAEARLNYSLAVCEALADYLTEPPEEPELATQTQP